jgi:cold shock CspA family protein
LPEDIDRALTGTVEAYDDQAGYGYIVPDADQGLDGRLLVHRASLRSADLRLRPTDKVAFSTRSVPTGVLAVDVRLAAAAAIERIFGTIKRFDVNKGFGFIATDNGRDVFVHISQMAASDGVPVAGQLVSFVLTPTPRGPQAFDVSLEEVLPVGDDNLAGTPPGLVGPDSSLGVRPTQAMDEHQDFLAQAIIARDAKKYEEAVALYEKGLRLAPSVQLVLSYAAMEKNRGRRRAAMRVYEEGIKRFPSIAKLREDAGILAAGLDPPEYDRALKLLREALTLCEQHRQGGTKGVLLALARTNYDRALSRSSSDLDTRRFLERAIKHYEDALKAFGRGATHLPEDDLLAMNTAKIRLQHHRGNLTVQFLRRAGFRVVRARLLEQTTSGAELVVEVGSPELRESYGLSRYLIVRTMFKTDVSKLDLDSVDRSVLDWSASGLGDEQVAIMVVASLPDDLQRLLAKRIEEHKKSLPAIVPLQQTDMERYEEPTSALRAVLDRWLFRRDLFAGNAPVVGRRFFGRDKPLAELRTSVSGSAPIGIFGLRKVGKTSLLKEAQRRASEWGDVVVYVDLLRVPSDISDCSWLYWRLASDLRNQAARLPLTNFKWRLGGEFADFLDIPATFPIATAFDSDLTRLLEAVQGLGLHPRPKVVFLLDEIERLLPTGLGKAGFSGFFDFFSYLRGVSQEFDDFVLIVTGANALITEAAQFDGRDNPVFNYFSEVYLQLLEPQECSLMVRELGRGMGISFTPEALESIYSLTGGHPFFARQLCSYTARRFEERPLKLTREIIESQADDYIDVRSSDFQEIIERLARDFPSELGVCVQLARSKDGVPVQDIRNHSTADGGSAIRHLLGYQVVSIKAGRAVLTVELLRRWLRQRYADAN